jgi:hypothetical protein
VDLTKAAMASELTYQQVRDVLEGMVADGLCVRAAEPVTYFFPSLAGRQRAALPEASSDAEERPPAAPRAEIAVLRVEDAFEVDAETGIVVPKREP